MNRREFLVGAAGVLGAAVNVPVLASSPVAPKPAARMFALMTSSSVLPRHILTCRYCAYTPDGIHAAAMQVKDFLRDFKRSRQYREKIPSFVFYFGIVDGKHEPVRKLILADFTPTELYETANGFFEQYAETLAVRNVLIDNRRGTYAPSYFD